MLTPAAPDAADAADAADAVAAAMVRLPILPGWRPKWADLPTLTRRARAGKQWPVPKTDARIVFLVEFWV